MTTKIRLAVIGTVPSLGLAFGRSSLRTWAPMQPCPRLATDSACTCSPWLLNCRNGIVNLETGELQDHQQDDLCTKQAPIWFDPGATAPLFEAVVERALPDSAVRQFLRRWAGTALTGNPIQALLLCVGSGANSKSVIMESLQRAIGDDYAVVPHKSLLVAGRHEQHPTHLASLHNARLVVAPETQAGDRLNEELIKNLTGQDTQRARRMRENEWSFRPTWSAAMHTNHLPNIRGTDEAIWRRLHHVPFAVTIPVEERDETLLEQIVESELPGVINWMLSGCLEWQERSRRLDPPKIVADATNRYRVDHDHIGRFFEARCSLQPNKVVAARDLRGAYERWCKEDGESPWTAKAVGAELRRRGCESGRIGVDNVRVWRGIGIVGNDALEREEDAS